MVTRYPLFVLSVIDFESELIDYDDLHERYCAYDKVSYSDFRKKYLMPYYGHRLYKAWRSLNYNGISLAGIDRFLNFFLKEHISVGRDFTWFGYNAMQWAIQVRMDKKFLLFRPPHVRVFPRIKFSIGRCYISPNGTPGHEEAIHYYGEREW